MQVTDEEVDEAGLAVKGYIWANVPSWTGADHVSAHDLRGIARAAILAYLATPGQVKLKEDAERWRFIVASDDCAITMNIGHAWVLVEPRAADATIDAARAAESKP